MSDGWVKLHRRLVEKPIWLCSTPEQKVILITLLMMANHDEKEWEWQGEKYHCKPGEFITSLPSIASECGSGISTQNVRTALLRFEKYGFLTCKSTNKNRKITIENWGKYQGQEDAPNRQTNRQLTGNQQATNRQLTANKNDKNDKNDKKENIVSGDHLEIITYLNERADTNYKATSKKTQSLIHARLEERFTVDDFKRVIDNKVAEWTGTEWQKYLRPETLFGTKFESYLNSKPSLPKGKQKLYDQLKGTFDAIDELMEGQ